MKKIITLASFCLCFFVYAQDEFTIAKKELNKDYLDNKVDNYLDNGQYADAYNTLLNRESIYGRDETTIYKAAVISFFLMSKNIVTSPKPEVTEVIALIKRLNINIETTPNLSKKNIIRLKYMDVLLSFSLLDMFASNFDREEEINMAKYIRKLSNEIIPEMMPQGADDLKGILKSLDNKDL